MGENDQLTMLMDSMGQESGRGMGMIYLFHEVGHLRKEDSKAESDSVAGGRNHLEVSSLPGLAVDASCQLEP